jgi:hypothetical protein
MRHTVITVPAFSGPSTTNDCHLMGAQGLLIAWVKFCELSGGYLASVLGCSL